ncbi:hypothetical protein B0H14DRAFT_2616755 [Mycena olivaceomarginata]|nr:hypothetical protein B0H14DRAFT_2616755 [Mycena olivaceomarginata]
MCDAISTSMIFGALSLLPGNRYFFWAERQRQLSEGIKEVCEIRETVICSSARTTHTVARRRESATTDNPSYGISMTSDSILGSDRDSDGNTVHQEGGARVDPIRPRELKAQRAWQRGRRTALMIQRAFRKAVRIMKEALRNMHKPEEEGGLSQGG